MLFQPHSIDIFSVLSKKSCNTHKKYLGKCLVKKRKKSVCLDMPSSSAILQEKCASTDKPYSKACVTSKDSDQPVYPPSMSGLLVYPFLDSSEADQS